MKRIFLAIFGILILGIVAGPVRAESGVPKPGDPFPNLALNYLGKEPELGGKPVLVEFWATWCPPCRESIPHLNQIYSKYRSKGLEIVGITNENEATVKKFQQQVAMDYNVAINAPQSVYDQFGIDAIPTAFLVNKAGKIVWTGHPMELTDVEIQGVLN